MSEAEVVDNVPGFTAPSLPLHTERLVLRLASPDDAAALRYAGDPEVARYLPFGPLDEDGLQRRLERMLQATAPTAAGDALAVVVEHQGSVIGDLLLLITSQDRADAAPAVAELGWVFSPEAGGRGFATEAVRALLDLAFEHYPLHRLTARHDPRNLRSAALCERIGMTREGRLRQDSQAADGTWLDVDVQGILRAEWSAGR
jgi:RimJ/RimL family protein N-acetyltransferase